MNHEHLKIKATRFIETPGTTYLVILKFRNSQLNRNFRMTVAGKGKGKVFQLQA
jgi:hypothetical protein